MVKNQVGYDMCTPCGAFCLLSAYASAHQFGEPLQKGLVYVMRHLMSTFPRSYDIALLPDVAGMTLKVEDNHVVLPHWVRIVQVYKLKEKWKLAGLVVTAIGRCHVAIVRRLCLAM